MHPIIMKHRIRLNKVGVGDDVIQVILDLPIAIIIILIIRPIGTIRMVIGANPDATIAARIIRYFDMIDFKLDTFFRDA